MQIKQNISLKSYNTFAIDVKAAYFISVSKVEELVNILQLQDHHNRFILGGGSNMLLTKDVDELVVHINLKGKEIISKNGNEVIIKAHAGENWHEFVLWTLENNFGGLQNLSLIPGNVGSSPIQNIGAYGVELKDTFVTCEALEVETQKMKSFSLADCKFGYRDSIFKNEAKGKYIITSVTFKLSTDHHTLNTSYGAIEDHLHESGIKQPTIKDISNAVISIRKSKLPDPAELGNSGSFFKNPIISKAAFDAFIKTHQNAPYHIVSKNEIKIPAGWLIEQCGFKGSRFNDAGVHSKQALVLVNYGRATGKEIWDLAMKIQSTVKEKFGIAIVPEVNVF